jgi:aryl-alcohol dehydrogenase-like predicted oxidoreductase
LLVALVDGRRQGRYRAVGLTLSGPDSGRTLARALEARVDAERVFDVVQATFNVLEPSLAGPLREAHDAGLGVIAKEVFANGRLSAANTQPGDAPLLTRLRARAPAGAVDRLAVAFVLAHPFVDVALSGAATVAQLDSHLAATAVVLSEADRTALADVAEPPLTYWATRASLPWS